MDLGLRSRWVRWRQEAALPTFYLPSMRSTTSFVGDPSPNYDRFIPNRSTTDFDLGRTLLTDSRKEKEKSTLVSPSKEAYRKHLAEALMQNRTRIFAFKNKPAEPVEDGFQECSSVLSKSVKRLRHIPQSAEHILEVLELVDDFYLNLLDWGSSNVLSVAVGSTIYLWNPKDCSSTVLTTVDESHGPVTSVNWAPDGKHIAIGLSSSDVQFWDVASNRLLRTLRGVHQSRVGSLAWNRNILTTGGMDGMIVNNDVRARSHIVQTYRGHKAEVCGLKWSSSGQKLASGGNDNLIHIWDLRMSSNPPRNQNQWLHRFGDHMAEVKALAWCPFQNNLLASGGGATDRCIKLWNAQTGARLNSVDTGSQVSGLHWNENERELLSSHGFTRNQLTLWKYPLMVKVVELTGHISQVLFTAQSPDGYTVASAAAGDDNSLRIWNAFGTPKVTNPATKAGNAGAFSSFNHIR